MKTVMNLKQLKSVVAKGESEIVEFKKSTAQLRGAFETVCAFLNGGGGLVLIGVDDKGKIVGQDVTDNTRQEIAREVSKLEPSARIDINYIGTKENKYVIAIQAHPNHHAPYAYDGRPFGRNQTTTVRMSQHRYEELIVARGHLNHSWEEVLIPDYTIKELDREEIHKTIAEGIQENRIPASALKDDVPKILKRLGLSENGKLKRAAAILYAKETFPDFLQCMIKMARFKGTTKLGDFIDNQQIYCNAFTMLKEADAFLQRHLPIASFFRKDSIHRIDKLALPAMAVREALINAICHRDYSNRSASISLAIYDDRLEIWNNGTLPKPLKLADLKRSHESMPRNKLISKVFHARGLIETWGTGTNKMIDLCKADQVPEPIFEEHTGGLNVIFRFKEPIGMSSQKTAKPNLLNIRQEEILQLLQSGKPLSADEIFNQLKTPPSLRTVKADLSVLKKMNLVEQQGKARSTIWKAK